AFRNGSRENEFPFELSLEFGEVLLFGDRSKYRVGGDCAIGARRPGFGVSDERKRMRSDHLDVGALIGPAAAEWAPRFEMDVGEFPRVHRFGGPLGGVFDVRGIGEAWA